MLRILSFLIGMALAMGIGEVGIHGLMAMAGKAASAQQHDQISYSKWNNMLWGRRAKR